MNIKKTATILISGFVLLVLFCYAVFLFIVPLMLNSNFAMKKFEKIASKKFGYSISTEGFKYYSKANLSFGIKSNKIVVNNLKSKDAVLSIKYFDYKSKILSLKPKKIKIHSLFINCLNLKSKKKNPDGQIIDLDLLSVIDIGKIFIKIDNNSNLIIKNIQTKKLKRKLYYNMLGNFENKKYLKNSAIIGKNGYIIHDGKNIIFENFSIELGKSKLLLSGKNNDLRIIGKNLPLSEVKSLYVYFYRLMHKNKKNFIENFHDLDGALDINLTFFDDTLTGNCVIKDVKAKLFDYKIPIKIPMANFRFKDNKITTKTVGEIDKNLAPLTFKATGLFSDEFAIMGDVKTTIDTEFAQKYYPDIKIEGYAKLVVKYKTQKGKVDVDYKMVLEKGSDVTYQKYKLGSGKRKREIEAFTTKIGDTISLKKYLYSFYDKEGKKVSVFSGDGQFKKNNSHFVPSFLTIKTLKQIPLSAVQFITKDYVEGGKFTSDLKFDFLNKKIFGKFDLFDVHHKDFLTLHSLHLEILNDVVQLNTEGLFFNSPITMRVIAENDFHDRFLVHDVDIHLNKFLVKREKLSELDETYKNIQKPKIKKRNYNVEIEAGKIVVDEIVHPRFYLHDVEILGNLQDDVVNFLTKPTQYAKGSLISVGSYNIAQHSSEMDFCASDIDSNEVVTKIFKLPNQVKGLASATLHLKTKNKLSDIKADAAFMIENGSLPKIGSTEFMFKKTKRMKKFKFINFEKIKFTLSKITNIDFSNKKAPPVAQIDGTFSFDNEHVKNTKIFFTSDVVSMFIEGDYNINSQLANLTVWGRHNKTVEKKIRILKLPFTFLYRIIFKPEHTKDLHTDKIKNIPPVKLKMGDEESFFRVMLEGNINSDNFRVNMNDLK